MKKNAAIYARVSSLKQKEGDNIQSQVSALIEFANKENYIIPTGWTFTDEGYSGSILQRPALDELRELIQEGDVDAVLVYSPDRLSRKYAFQLILDAYSILSDQRFHSNPAAGRTAGHRQNTAASRR